MSSESKEPSAEILLHGPESLLVQFSGRTIYTSSDAVDDRLTASFWLSPPRDEGDTDLEHVSQL